jgi:type I restriction enzyme, S subunit
MSLAKYAKYRETAVEWMATVPEHWAIAPLLSCSTERAESNKGMLERNLLSLSYGRIVTKDIASNDGLLPESFETYQIVRPNDIVIRPTDLQNDWNSLRSAIVEETGIITFAYIAVTPNGIHPRYLAYLLRAYDLTKVFYSMGGGLRQSLKYSDVKRLPIVLPPPAEQAAIAIFLDHETARIDALVAEQQHLIELLKEKRQAVISSAVTKGLDPKVPMRPSGVEWLGDVPSHWSVGPVGSRYSVQLGKMLDSEKITGKHLRPYLRVYDVQWGVVNTEDLPKMDFNENDRKRFRLMPGDLLVNEGGSYPGRSAIWSGGLEECYYQKALHRMRPYDAQRDATRYLFYAMVWAANHGVFTAGGNEATIEHLPAERLRRYRFPFPSFAEQNEVASFLDAETAKLDTLTAEAQRAIDLLQERRTALVSAAVTGQIDVREQR